LGDRAGKLLKDYDETKMKDDNKKGSKFDIKLNTLLYDYCRWWSFKK